MGDFSGQGSEEQDATMTDIGEKSRPPGDPPDAVKIWVSKVVGSNVGGRLTPEKVLEDVFVEERLQVEFPNGEDGEPVITIGKEVLDAMKSLWKNCMIVKVLGRNVSISLLNRKLRELWKPRGGMHVIDLPHQFYMVRFEEEAEYLAALTGGPWRAFGSYLMVKGWSPEFDPMKDEIITTLVWIRLANIPVNFYHNSILMGIARGLGTPVKVDDTTLNFERARFARVCDFVTHGNLNPWIIPEEFVRSTPGAFDHRVVFSVRWGNSWQLWLERDKKDLLMIEEDWHMFVDDNHLGPNDNL